MIHAVQCSRHQVSCATVSWVCLSTFECLHLICNDLWQAGVDKLPSQAAIRNFTAKARWARSQFMANELFGVSIKAILQQDPPAVRRNVCSNMSCSCPLSKQGCLGAQHLLLPNLTLQIENEDELLHAVIQKTEPWQRQKLLWHIRASRGKVHWVCSCFPSSCCSLAATATRSVPLHQLLFMGRLAHIPGCWCRVVVLCIVIVICLGWAFHDVTKV